jgi:hypothetical protein
MAQMKGTGIKTRKKRIKANKGEEEADKVDKANKW